jgi:lipoprotein-anchoring transpeptidase ErfK/SrfK
VTAQRLRRHDNSSTIAWRAAAVIVAAALPLAGCGSQHSSETSSPATSATVTTTPTTVPAYESIAAQAINPRLPIFASPRARTAKVTLANPWLLDPTQPNTAVPQVFLVEARRKGWVRVLLPVRPNGSTGWVRARDVKLSPVTYKIRVQRRAHRITVFDRGVAIYTGPIADGAPATPTPIGHYYIRVLIKAPDPNTVYGPYAYGLSSHSDALSTFDGADAEIGIHGNDDASVLGHSITHGCIRMDNAEITRLSRMLPLGAPVDIEP